MKHTSVNKSFLVAMTVFLLNACGGSSGGGGSTDAAGFFQEIKGAYEYFVSKSAGAGEGHWTDKGKYTITVHGDEKSVSFETDAEPIKLTFGSDVRDSFKDEGHEQNAFLYQGNATLIVQRQDGEVSFVYGDQGNWNFNKNNTGTDPNLTPFEQGGITYAIESEHAVVLTSVTGADPRWNVGDSVTMTIDAVKAEADGTFGKFTWDEHSGIEAGAVKGRPTHRVRWCKPDCVNGTRPQERFSITFYQDDGSLRRLDYYEVPADSSKESVLYYYQVD